MSLPVRVHWLALKTPWPLLVKLTVPVGGVGVPGEKSLTEAVHSLRTGVVCWQFTDVMVTRRVTVRGSWPLLAMCLLSPSYVPAIVSPPASACGRIRSPAPRSEAVLAGSPSSQGA